jgi:hypothetical protein
VNHVYLSISPENVITVLLIVAVGYGIFSLVGQGLVNWTAKV